MEEMDLMLMLKTVVLLCLNKSATVYYTSRLALFDKLGVSMLDNKKLVTHKR